jgi:hypothetical protein
LLPAILLGIPSLAKTPKASVRGKLKQPPGKKPVIETPDRKVIFLEGDKATTGVLKDKRLAGEDLEVIGRFRGLDLFVVDPIHTRAMFVHKNGQRLMITYWCDVCAIRTYTPGLCWCCQEETELDLRKSDRP